MNPSPDWRPTASISALKARAILIQKIRDFFADHDVWEVETPILAKHTVTDCHLDSIATDNGFLQTSPEYHMKRLLAAGSGSIYQISKVFRAGECGRHHNPEFTLLEWYRVDYDYHELMTEVTALIKSLVSIESVLQFSYQDLFIKYCDLDPHAVSLSDLENYFQTHCIDLPTDLSKDDCLQLLMSHLIEPQFSDNTLTFVYDYPPSQAVLSTIREDSPPVAERFEAYIGQLEIANGFQELRDPELQSQRFDDDLRQRKQLSKTDIVIDAHFLSALKHGLPFCAGVAVGIDRLCMAALQAQDIRTILSFTHKNA